MWYRLLTDLRCPLCAGALACHPFEEERVALTVSTRELAAHQGVLSDEFDRYVAAGLLLCENCRRCFAITDGVPVLLPYRLPLHTAFTAKWQAQFQNLPGYEFPDLRPMPGERQVLESFSKEWLEYSYDGVLWTSTYEDQEAALLREIPLRPLNSPGNQPIKFLEVGCGIGVITYLAHKNWAFNAVGVDLSLAAFRAAEHYKSNPFLHFVQASAFYLPFAKRSFEVIYSRGVLHHTFSTQKALTNVGEYCADGGGFFVWLYGPGSTRDNLFRRAAYLAESLARPLLSRFPSSWVTQAVLRALALAYVAVNGIQRRRNPKIEPYTFIRALHAARDRFTPRFAHRQSFEQVAAWCRAAGFREVRGVDWTSIPGSLQENYRRNVGVWAQRAPSLTAK